MKTEEPFKKFSMYNENKETTASDNTGGEQNEGKTAERIKKEAYDYVDGLRTEDAVTAYIAGRKRADQELAFYKEALRELIVLAEGYSTYLSGVLDYLPNDIDGKHELENAKAIIDKARALIKDNLKQ